MLGTNRGRLRLSSQAPPTPTATPCGEDRFQQAQHAGPWRGRAPPSGGDRRRAQQLPRPGFWATGDPRGAGGTRQPPSCHTCFPRLDLGCGGFMLHGRVSVCPLHTPAHTPSALQGSCRWEAGEGQALPTSPGGRPGQRQRWAVP